MGGGGSVAALPRRSSIEHASRSRFDTGDVFFLCFFVFRSHVNPAFCACVSPLSRPFPLLSLTVPKIQKQFSSTCICIAQRISSAAWQPFRAFGTHLTLSRNTSENSAIQSDERL